MIAVAAVVIGLVFGAYIHRAATNGIMRAQHDAHLRQMDELYEELLRARTQVADLIGKA